MEVGIIVYVNRNNNFIKEDIIIMLKYLNSR